MALFKILRGSNENLPDKKTDGYCYFTTDTGMFYIDISDNERLALNASDAQTLLGKTIITDVTKDSVDIPTSGAVWEAIKNLSIATNTALDTKMDKVNPTGTGYFSLNRKAGSSVGDYSFAEGYNTTASGIVAHAEGDHTTASGSAAHAEGGNTIASGNRSHAEGDGTKASGLYSHAEGAVATASGSAAHAEGGNTLASGNRSHAEGKGSLAEGDYSHAEGYKTIASGNRSHAEGKYNIEDTENKYAHIVGNGDATTRSNAYTLDWEGNAWFAGNVNATAVYGAVWNDYAEYRDQIETIEPGYCVVSADNGQVSKTTEKFQVCDGIVSDTFGFAIGETDNCKTPLAVAGRVLAYCEGDRLDYHAGDTVCAGPNGKVTKMTREEIREWPDRIVGTVSEIPMYETWGTGNVAVNGRIWIKIK